MLLNSANLLNFFALYQLNMNFPTLYKILI